MQESYTCIEDGAHHHESNASAFSLRDPRKHTARTPPKSPSFGPNARQSPQTASGVWGARGESLRSKTGDPLNPGNNRPSIPSAADEDRAWSTPAALDGTRASHRFDPTFGPPTACIMYLRSS
jgi:hypothetical protein